MDVLEGCGVGRFRGNAEVQGRDDDAVLGHGFVADVAVLAGAVDPGAAVQFNHYREGAVALGLEQLGLEGLIAVAEIFHVLNLDGVGSLFAESHTGLLKFGGLVCPSVANVTLDRVTVNCRHSPQGYRSLRIRLTAETQSTRRFAEIFCASLCALRLCGKWRAVTGKLL